MVRRLGSVTGLLIHTAAQIVPTQGLPMVARLVPRLPAYPLTTVATAASPIPMRPTQVLRQGPRLHTAPTRVVARRP